MQKGATYTGKGAAYASWEGCCVYKEKGVKRHRKSSLPENSSLEGW